MQLINNRFFWAARGVQLDNGVTPHDFMQKRWLMRFIHEPLSKKGVGFHYARENVK